ncbi:hypothetical protein TNCT_527361 [Trichonephila clavata]|uniref:Uncharacterized protein n=1 Tax=Trichonephila clavata TaxID=2740835 RepID=A0A8X6FDQ0_TRICU|nr:hypothetical protein TNCT_527361 [Trichonephila clavata]
MFSKIRVFRLHTLTLKYWFYFGNSNYNLDQGSTSYKDIASIMHPRIWIYKSDLSCNPLSPFHRDSCLVKKVAQTTFLFIGLLFFIMALLCLMYPKSDPDRTVFLMFVILSATCEIVFISFSCIPYMYNKFVSCIFPGEGEEPLLDSSTENYAQYGTSSNSPDNLNQILVY